MIGFSKSYDLKGLRLLFKLAKSIEMSLMDDTRLSGKLETFDLVSASTYSISGRKMTPIAHDTVTVTVLSLSRRIEMEGRAGLLLEHTSHFDIRWRRPFVLHKLGINFFSDTRTR